MTVKNVLEKIPDIILAQLAAFSLVYGLTSSLMLTCPALNILLLVMLFIAVLYGFSLNKYTSYAAYAVLGTAALLTAGYIIFGTGISKAITFLDDYFYWLGEFIQYPDAPDPVFQNVTVLALCILLSVFAYIFILRKFMFLVIAAAGIGLFTIQWSYEIVSSLVPFYIYLLITLVAYLKHIYLLKSAKTSNEFATTGILSIWSLPVCILIIALASSFYASSKPIEWKWLDKKIFSVYNYFSRNLDYEAFDYFSLAASSGFGDRNNILGGRVKLDRTNVLRVETSKNIYLKGSIQDTYTGALWTSRLPKKTSLGRDYNSIYGDTSEMLLGMKILTDREDFLEDYFFTNTVSVSYLNLKTKSLFIPDKTMKFSPKSSSLQLFSDKNGSFSTEKRLTKGFAYDLEMYSPEIGKEEFADALRKSKKGLYSEYLIRQDFPTYFEAIAKAVPADLTTSSGALGISILGADSAGNLTQIQVEDLEAYKELTLLKDRSAQIYSDYLQLPPNLPQRVKDLAASLVAKGKTDYDKAKAIEQYLSKNYPYNLDVRSTPRNRDFVDYFLFDLKQGYCSYYASAMAILARCAGLPSRYVEGYMLPPEPTKDNNSTYIVTNMQAHAWVEIYFEGYGWLPFEPTSPFSSTFYSSETSEAVLASSYNSAYEDYMEMMRRYGRDREPGDLSGPYTPTDKTPVEIYILAAVGTLIFLFLLLLLFNLTRGRFRLYKLVNRPAKDCILRFYDYYVYVLSLLGLGLVPAETPLQYSGRIDEEMFFSPVRFKVITEIFMKARYSLREANEKEKQLFCDFRQGFLDEVKISMGKTRYFIFKYVLGKF